MQAGSERKALPASGELHHHGPSVSSWLPVPAATAPHHDGLILREPLAQIMF